MELKVLDEYADELRIFQEWIKTQPLLPQNISKLLVIIRFLLFVILEQKFLVVKF